AYQQALRLKPNFADAINNLGNALLQRGNVDDAIALFKKVLQIKPGYAEAINNLGNALFQKGNVDGAIAQYQQALEIDPGYAQADYNLGIALLQKGNVDEAIAHYRQALKTRPDYTDAINNLGNALLQKGEVEAAVRQYEKLLQLKPDYLEAQNNLAWILATAAPASLRDGKQAVALAERSNQLSGGESPVVLRTLAAAYAEAGRFDDARQNAQKAMELARVAGQSDLGEQIQGELKLYTAGLPFHQDGK
ncbi:MAG TPA: tetratricopeptide repeat protein, partial [Candidatus Acidoferrales bacterium]|nr:tetratricopeptide repeat protein [Candidatus Acidoferrales bacterium]